MSAPTPRPADFSLSPPTGEGGRRLALSGDWTVTRLADTGERLRAALGSTPPGGVETAGLGRIDTAGALALSKAGVGAQQVSERADAAQLLQLVGAARRDVRPAQPPPRMSPAYRMLDRAGRAVVAFVDNLVGIFAFNGRLMVAVSREALHPSRIRPAATVSLMERAGLDAAPIIALTNFFVGATIAFLGASLLRQFGAQVFAVELVGIGVLREFGTLVTAIILAGRSASSFAAEIGAMRMNQEIDAMAVIGVDPFEALVIPRFLAMLTMEPLLTFVAMISGLAGGVLVVWASLGLSPLFFLQRLLENVPISHFWIGLCKAPVMAVVIAAIGCREGLEVGGDVEQLGRRVTSAVVQALFSIILIDAAFAFLFLELGL